MIAALGEARSLGLGTAAARKLATTTKTRPTMQGITPRWLLQMLPWVETQAGAFRVNRRETIAAGGLLTFTIAGGVARVAPQALRQLPALRDLPDDDVLEELAGLFVQQGLRPGEILVERGRPADSICLVVEGKLEKLGADKLGEPIELGMLGDGDHLGAPVLREPVPISPFAVRAATAATVLVLQRDRFDALVHDSPRLRAHLEQLEELARRPRDKDGQAAIQLAAGHDGEVDLPATFVDYEARPREYELSVAQTILRVHTRVADLYNDPMDQLSEQLRLTIEALRETQEHELINNREFGLLHSVDPKQRLQTRSGPPTPDDLDTLLARRRKSRFFLAHPRAIAAIGHQCSRAGIYPQTLEVNGATVRAWRGVPILPCDKIPISAGATTSILVLRTGLDDQGVIGLRQTGIPDEHEPGLNVRFMGIDDKAILSYLVSTYYSAAVLVPDALGILDNVTLR